MAELRFHKPPERPELLRVMREDARYDAASSSDPVAACPPGFLSGDIRAKAPPPKVPKGIFVQSMHLQLRLLRLPGQQWRKKTRYCVQPRRWPASRWERRTGTAAASFDVRHL